MSDNVHAAAVRNYEMCVALSKNDSVRTHSAIIWDAAEWLQFDFVNLHPRHNITSIKHCKAKNNNLTCATSLFETRLFKIFCSSYYIFIAPDFIMRLDISWAITRLVSQALITITNIEKLKWWLGVTKFTHGLKENLENVQTKWNSTS